MAKTEEAKKSHTGKELAAKHDMCKPVDFDTTIMKTVKHSSPAAKGKGR